MNNRSKNRRSPLKQKSFSRIRTRSSHRRSNSQRQKSIHRQKSQQKSQQKSPQIQSSPPRRGSPKTNNRIQKKIIMALGGIAGLGLTGRYFLSTSNTGVQIDDIPVKTKTIDDPPNETPYDEKNYDETPYDEKNDDYTIPIIQEINKKEQLPDTKSTIEQKLNKAKIKAKYRTLQPVEFTLYDNIEDIFVKAVNNGQSYFFIKLVADNYDYQTSEEKQNTLLALKKSICKNFKFEEVIFNNKVFITPVQKLILDDLYRMLRNNYLQPISAIKNLQDNYIKFLCYLYKNESIDTFEKLLLFAVSENEIDPNILLFIASKYNSTYHDKNFDYYTFFMKLKKILLISKRQDEVSKLRII